MSIPLHTVTKRCIRTDFGSCAKVKFASLRQRLPKTYFLESNPYGLKVGTTITEETIGLTSNNVVNTRRL